MGLRTQYAPGTFSWTDLNTTDQEAAKQFYADLFGWELTDMPVGEGFAYTMAAIDGQSVAAIAGQMPAQQDTGAPPAWNSYITVEDADATAARATELGATVHAAPFDAIEAGRMAVIQDPQEAWFLIWQPRRHIGAGLVNAPGALCWNELGTPDLGGSARFYRELFGWTTAPMEGTDSPYLVITSAAGTSNGGIRPPAPPGSPPFWLVYFATADLQASLAKVAELGGTVLAGDLSVGPGRIAIVEDPQGAVFALYHGSLDP